MSHGTSGSAVCLVDTQEEGGCTFARNVGCGNVKELSEARVSWRGLTYAIFCVANTCGLVLPPATDTAPTKWTTWTLVCGPDVKTSRANASDEHNFLRSGSRVEDGVGEGGDRRGGQEEWESRLGLARKPHGGALERVYDGRGPARGYSIR